MFSLKVCLAGLALALFVAPAAASVEEVNFVARRSALTDSILSERDLVARGSLLKRDSRTESAARVRLAKTRAARKAKRDAASFVEKRAATTAFTGSASTLAFATYLGTKCSRNKQCANAQVKAVLPTNGGAVCDFISRHCAIDCAATYSLQSDGSCLAQPANCPPLSNGHYTTGTDGSCVPSCNTSLGYTLSTATGTPKCINTSTGSSNCGSVGNVCAGSYNGVGTKKCVSGICTLKCTTGTFVYTTKSGKVYCA